MDTDIHIDMDIDIDMDIGMGIDIDNHLCDCLSHCPFSQYLPVVEHMPELVSISKRRIAVSTKMQAFSMWIFLSFPVQESLSQFLNFSQRKLLHVQSVHHMEGGNSRASYIAILVETPHFLVNIKRQKKTNALEMFCLYSQS